MLEPSGRNLKPPLIIRLLFVFALFVSLIMIYMLRWETRMAMFSCGYCGNCKIVRLETWLWGTASVHEYTSNEFPIPAGHVHRWWQFDGHLTNPLQNWGWSRNKYEDGKFIWSEPMKADVVENHRLIKEDWLRME